MCTQSMLTLLAVANQKQGRTVARLENVKIRVVCVVKDATSEVRSFLLQSRALLSCEIRRMLMSEKGRIKAD